MHAMTRDSLVLNELRSEARGNERLRDKIENAELRVETLLLRQQVDELRREQAAGEPQSPEKPEGRPVLGQAPMEPDGPATDLQDRMDLAAGKELT